MSIPSFLVMLLKMTLVNIIVIYVKKKETQNNGFTTVHIVVILLIRNVFLENIQILNLEFFTYLTVTHTPLLWFIKLKTTMHVTNVTIPAMKCFSNNVYHVISTCTGIVYRKDKYGFNFYFILDLVHVISSVKNSSNDNAIVIFNDNMKIFFWLKR